MPYDVIDPFREAVERIVRSGRPRLAQRDTRRLVRRGSGLPPGRHTGARQTLAVSVTQLPDGAMGQFLPSRPDGLLRVTMQIDVWHQWRVAAEDLADAVSRGIDGGVAPGLASIQSGVRATAYDPDEVKWRVSQRFAVTAYDERM